jgi:D-lactate dehydrogenase (cytochrome)
MATGDALAELGQRFGDRLSTSASLRRDHAGIETHAAAMHPDGVVMARNAGDVADALAICRAHGVAVIAHGAGTSLEGHLSAVTGGISLDLTGMDRIISIDRDNFLCRVEAGVTREQLNRELRASGLFFPLDPGANATLGGMAATGASGTNAVRYGTMRENVRSLKVVLADGRSIETGTSAAKSSAGYDLTRLMVGSEGTLGIITEVTLRLHPVPETIAAATCFFPDLDGAVQTVIEAIQSAIPMARIELLDAAQIAACNAYSRLELPVAPTLFLEFHGNPASVPGQIEQFRAIATSNGAGGLVFADEAEDRTRLWKARHDAYFAAGALRKGSRTWSTDVCVPISALAESVTATREDVDACGLTATIVGHVGDGNYHVLFVLDPQAPAELAAAEAINARMVSRAIALGGTCTGEHGIGNGKQVQLIEECGADAVAVMAMIKHALDPDGILNPGKIFAHVAVERRNVPQTARA